MCSWFCVTESLTDLFYWKSCWICFLFWYWQSWQRCSGLCLALTVVFWHWQVYSDTNRCVLTLTGCVLTLAGILALTGVFCGLTLTGVFCGLTLTGVFCGSDSDRCILWLWQTRPDVLCSGWCASQMCSVMTLMWMFSVLSGNWGYLFCVLFDTDIPGGCVL